MVFSTLQVFCNARSFENWGISLGYSPHSHAVRVPTAFLVLANFHSCLYNSIETRYMFYISYIFIYYISLRCFSLLSISQKCFILINRSILWPSITQASYFMYVRETGVVQYPAGCISFVTCGKIHTV